MQLSKLLSDSWIEWHTLAESDAIYVNDIPMNLASLEQFTIEFSNVGKHRLDGYDKVLPTFLANTYESLIKKEKDAVGMINSQVGRYLFKNGFLLTVNRTTYVIYDNNRNHEPSSNWESK